LNAVDDFQLEQYAYIVFEMGTARH